MFRIAIDISAFSAPHLSGVGEYILNLLKNLFEIDSENQYFLFYNSFHKIQIPKFDFKNVKIIKLHYPNKFLALTSFFLRYPKIDLLIKKRVGPIDICFLPRPNYFLFSKSIKTILLIFDLSFKIFPQFFTYKDLLFWQAVNLKKNINHYDWVVTISNHTKKDIISLLNYPDEKISVLYPGINKDFCIITDQNKLKKIKNKYNLPDHFIFYLGNLEPRKNLISLILAFDQLLEENPFLKNLNLKLIIAGALIRPYQNLFKTIQKIKNLNQIAFLGYLPAEDRVFLYNLASVFVYPSFYEGFGLPVLEAMACGCPVIASNNSSLPEVVKGAGLLIDPYNLNELKEAILSLLTDQLLRNNLKEAGLRQIKKFSWQKSANQLLEIFNKI